ncbi:YicC/YloC family endoribonuclease [Siminovitchia fordii]|nr:YicC/YloC family endoribonuclease [Siminovitchia fordii]
MSMTGFGRSVKQTDKCMVQVEIKTVNHRYREFHIKMPQQLSQAEIPLRNQLSKQFNRGRIELNVKLSGNISPGKELHIDWGLLDSYYHFIKEAKIRYRLTEEATLSDLLRMDNAVLVEETGDIDVEVLPLLFGAAEDAADQVLKMRETEGNSLSIELDTYISSLEELVQKTKELSPMVQKTYTERLRSKLYEMVKENIDETRIVSEAAIFADKADISEETARLLSHISQFREALIASGPIGRKMDFIIQEMNREVNTIGSKANDSNIAIMAVEMKVLIEKLREQVQNIE